MNERQLRLLKNSVTDCAPRPFMKWAGGKGQLLSILIHHYQQARPVGRYHEPFLGGGALFFHLFGHHALERKTPFLSDANARLMEAYECVARDVETVIELLRQHATYHSEAHFYGVRGVVPEQPVLRAARLIYLNRTCFNGLYRENSRGEFNVPMGRYKNPNICDAENLRAVSQALGRASLACRGYEESAKAVAEGDFVYLDPPYHPLSSTSSFTSYNAADFGEADQRRLAEVYRELHERGAKLLLSNSDTPLVRDLYRDFKVEEVQASRNLNSKAAGRGKITELLIRNYA